MPQSNFLITKKFKRDYTIKVKDRIGTIHYNFCAQAKNQCPGEEVDSAYAIYKSASTEKCLPLSLDASYYTGYEVKALVEGTSFGVQIKFGGAVKNPLNNGTYEHLKMKLYCEINPADKLLLIRTPDPVTYDPKTGEYLLIGHAKSACPVYSANGVLKWLEGFEWIYTVIAVVLGLIECFYGCRIFKVTLFLVSLPPTQKIRSDFSLHGSL
jgi:hypothetical protein